MPPEHEQLFAALSAILYFTRKVERFGYAARPERVVKGLATARQVLLQEYTKLGQAGRQRVSLGVLMAADRILDVTADKACHTVDVVGLISAACLAGLAPRKLSHVGSRTWNEQIAGRAALMAKRTWPELDW